MEEIIICDECGGVGLKNDPCALTELQLLPVLNNLDELRDWIAGLIEKRREQKMRSAGMGIKVAA